MEILNIDRMTIEELKEIDGFELLSKINIIERCHNYLDEVLPYAKSSVIEKFIDKKSILNYHIENSTCYVSDVKWETEEHNSNRINEEMEKLGVETEKDFINMLVDSAVNEGVDYFKRTFGYEDGFQMLILIDALNVKDLKDYSIEVDGYGYVLGREIHEVTIENEIHYLVEG